MTVVVSANVREQDFSVKPCTAGSAWGCSKRKRKA
jgi:hypothetical protein